MSCSHRKAQSTEEVKGRQSYNNLFCYCVWQKNMSPWNTAQEESLANMAFFLSDDIIL